MNASIFYAKLYDKEITIQNQNKQIDKLKTELMNKYQENQMLNGFRKQCYSLEEQIKEIEKETQKLRQEKLNIIKKNDENNALLKRKISELENVLDFERLSNEKNIVVFKQKMSVHNQLVMENELYSEEVKKLKNDLKELEEKKNQEFRTLKVENLLKFEKVKKKMFETLKLTNEKANELYKEYIETSDRLFILQNKQLLLHVNFLKEKIKDLQKTNDELKEKNIILQKDINIHKSIEKDLLIKSKGKNSETNNTNSEKIKSKYRTFYFKKRKDIKYYSQLNMHKRNNSELKEYNFDIKSPNLNKNNSTVNIISKPSVLERRLLSYQKQLKEKKFENENILIKNSKLKNRLHLYYNKFNGLFFFLEECLQNFFHDQSLVENKHFFVKMNDIKKFKFDEFNKDEKYSLLVLLMKHLIPLITLNFNNKDNIGKELFKTNLNIIDKNFNINQNYLSDKLLKNALMDNNHKYYKELYINSNSTNFSNSSIPVLRKLKNIDFDFYGLKNKAIFS